MKKLISIIAIAFVCVSFVFAGGAAEDSSSTVLKVGASPEPHGTLLNLVVDNLAEQGITLEIVEFTDYVMPNEALEAGEIDANYFQHLPYLESFNAIPSKPFLTERQSQSRMTRQTKEELFFSLSPQV